MRPCLKKIHNNGFMTLLCTIKLSFLFSKVGKPRVPTPWGCFEVGVMNMTARRTWLTYGDSCRKTLATSEAQIELTLRVHNVTNVLHLAHTGPCCCLRFSFFCASGAGSVGPLRDCQRAESACLLG